MNIIMLGYRGTGKSVISRILAQKLKRKLISIDKEIVKSAGLPIPQIVQKQGWPKFREIESRIVREVSSSEREAVIDCGGGVVLDDQNIACLKEQGRAVVLRADLQTLLKRIKNDSNRPPLKEGLSFEEEQKIILAEREHKYQSAADMTCDTTSRKAMTTAMAIIKFFQKKNWI
jgi:shikimate kinase